ncbi:MAG: thioesterase family protein [Chakrabartia sp.]
MVPLGQLIEGMSAAGEGRWGVTASDDWRQGRTLYGGISAALCFAACEKMVPDLPPLRSAQIAFVGPSSGEAMLLPRILRQGKSVSFLACDLVSDGAIATRALFAFGAERSSAFSAEAPHAPAVPQPEACPSLFGDRYPAFAAHFDMRLAAGSRPVTGAMSGDMLVWARYRDADLPPGLTALIAMADALPPAAMARMSAPAAISSMTWQFDLADAGRFAAQDWLLLRATDEAVGHGYSGQSMAIWDGAGQPILLGRQSVAIFA